jgi:deazaflavin-dependent oxidoreductase (nitroreductase family)
VTNDTNEFASEPIFDSPTAWVARHIAEYLLIYGRDGDSYVVVGSRGGAAQHPAWYLNLRANPDVDLQAGAEKIRARARTATGEEKTRLWRLMVTIWPQYDAYQLRTARKIPVVVLEPVKDE